MSSTNGLPPRSSSADLDMLASAAMSESILHSKNHSPNADKSKIPFGNQEAVNSVAFGCKRDTRIPTTPLQNPVVYKGQVHQPLQDLSGGARTKQYRHTSANANTANANKNNNHLRFLRVTSDDRVTLLPAVSTVALTPGELLRLQRSSQQQQLEAYPGSALTHTLPALQPSSQQIKGRPSQPIVKPTTLAAARRLAKVCLEQQQTLPSKHKALLFSGYKAHSAGKLGPAAPIVSRHLKQRRARADSYSSSSSDSTQQSSDNHIRSKPTLARDLRTMYESIQGGVSRITEDLANSLYLEKPTMQTVKSGYITSPSSDSTYSNHSLFSERSHSSNFTNHSSRPTSDNEHCMPRSSCAHPSAARILSLHHHSPEAESITPRRSNLLLATPASHGRLTQQIKSAYTTLDDPRSRYFARRNAIAPIGDAERQRSGTSSFGPMRTSKSLKTARTAVSHLSVPETRRPYSPPPIPSTHKMNLSFLIVPPRRASMPALYFNSHLGSPMRLASPRPKVSPSMNVDNDEDDDLDFCCKGYESPALPTPPLRPSPLFSPYRRGSSNSVSQLGQRRGKTVAGLKLR